jgi:2-polyprenyl-3-methyl-5-hydroxy-6-metoxy-1,4-benzoquinol methylase
MPDEEVVECELCGAGNARVLYTASDTRFTVDSRQFSILQCEDCGLGRLVPRPTAAAIKRYYPPSYYSYRSEATTAKRFAAQADYVSRMASGRLLDIGAAGGEFMAYMQRRGWDVTGLEPFAPEKISESLDIVDSWDALTSRGETFDVITAWSVFEHLHEPKAAFEKCRTLLRVGGRLILHVPNLNSPFSRLALAEDIPRHLYFFTAKTLQRYGCITGLRLTSVSHDTRIMDGRGLGFLRLPAARALGVSSEKYLRWSRIPNRTERWSSRPALAALSASLAPLERAITLAPLRRYLRFNGYIVVTYLRI